MLCNSYVVCRFKSELNYECHFVLSYWTKTAVISIMLFNFSIAQTLYPDFMYKCSLTFSEVLSVVSEFRVMIFDCSYPDCFAQILLQGNVCNVCVRMLCGQARQSHMSCHPRCCDL